jgi:hypothetical protein
MAMTTVLSSIADTSTTKVLDVMLNNPNVKYNMRSLAKAADVSVAAISKLRCIEELVNEGIVLKEQKSKREYAIYLNKENIIVKELLRIRSIKENIETEDPLILIDNLLDEIDYYYSYSTGAAVYGMSTYRIAMPDIIEVCVLKDDVNIVKNRFVGNFEVLENAIKAIETYAKSFEKRIVLLRKVDEIPDDMFRMGWLDGQINVASIEKVIADCIRDMLFYARASLCEDYAYIGLLKAKLNGRLNFKKLRKELKSRATKRLLAFMIFYTNKRYQQLFGENVFTYKERIKAKITEQALSFKPTLEAQFDELFVY